MTVYVGLLRAVNVGGTGKLPMADLKKLCEAEDFTHVETYIASGNVVFESKDSAKKVQARLEDALEVYAGKPVGLLVRTSAEMAAVLAANPFRDAQPTHVHGRNVPGRLSACGHAEGGHGTGGRGDSTREAGDLRPLSERPWSFQTQDSRCRLRHRAQPEHGHQTGPDGRFEVTGRYTAPRPIRTVCEGVPT